jgi:hypothetical protein
MEAVLTINQVTTAREIDDIIPLVNKLYEGKTLSKYISKAGYIAWLVGNIINHDFSIWYAMDEGEIKGFCVIQKTVRLFEFECHVHDVFMDWVDTKFSNEFFEKIELWAKEKQCTTITCMTGRPESMCKRFGFEQAGTLLIKAV